MSGAPGGKILSTWPLGAYGGYAIISGTSMATPFVAACYALVRSQYPGLSVAEVISLLQSTSTPMPYVYDTSFLSTVASQGSGMINPYNALTYKTTVGSSQLVFGDTGNFLNIPQTITINNGSPDSKTYTIKHQGGGYAAYFPYPDILPPDYYDYYGLPQYPIYASVSFTASTITVVAGQSYDLCFLYAAHTHAYLNP
jgi:subtilisin family serine protease